MSQARIPDNNLSVYLQKYKVEIKEGKDIFPFRNESLKEAGVINYDTVGAIPSNLTGKRVWEFNAEGSLLPDIDTYFIVYDFSKVDYNDKKGISFEDILSGTITICNHVLDASKYLHYKQENFFLIIKLDTSKLKFKIKRKTLFSFTIIINDSTDSSTVRFRSLCNVQDKKGNYTWTKLPQAVKQDAMLSIDCDEKCKSDLSIVFDSYDTNTACSLSKFILTTKSSITYDSISIQYNSTDTATTTESYTFEPNLNYLLEISDTTLTPLIKSENLVFSSLCPSTLLFSNSGFGWGYIDQSYVLELSQGLTEGAVYKLSITFSDFSECNTLSSFVLHNTQEDSYQFESLSIQYKSIQYNSSSTDIAKTTSAFNIDGKDIFQINIDTTNNTLTVIPNTINLNFSDLLCSDSNNTDEGYPYFTWNYLGTNSGVSKDGYQLKINSLTSASTISLFIAFQNYNNCKLSSFIILNDTEYSFETPELSVQYSDKATDIATIKTQPVFSKASYYNVVMDDTNISITVLDPLPLRFYELCSENVQTITALQGGKVLDQNSYSWSSINNIYQFQISNVTNTAVGFKGITQLQTFLIDFQNYSDTNCGTLSSFMIFNDNTFEIEIPKLEINYNATDTATTESFTMDAHDLFLLTIDTNDTNNPKSLIINPNTIDLNFKDCNGTENLFYFTWSSSTSGSYQLEISGLPTDIILNLNITFENDCSSFSTFDISNNSSYSINIPALTIPEYNSDSNDLYTDNINVVNSNTKKTITIS